MKKDSNRTNNGYFSIVTLCCLLVSSSLALASHQQQAATELFDLINQRLSYMKDVALYKAQHNIAIEDRNRETIVITGASQAATLSGIEAATAERFFGAQINAAKAIQKQVLKTYSEQQIAQAIPRDLGKEIRPALISLGEAILRKASDYLIR